MTERPGMPRVHVAAAVLHQPVRLWPRTARILVALAYHEIRFRLCCRRLGRPVAEVQAICRADRLSGRRS